MASNNEYEQRQFFDDDMPFFLRKLKSTGISVSGSLTTINSGSFFLACDSDFFDNAMRKEANRIISKNKK
jgi:hypothetical protein